MAARTILVLGSTGKTGRRVSDRLIKYPFTQILDGRNASVQDGVTCALGRPPRDFSDYMRDTAATGVCNVGSRS
jgi:short subunit dehydrogenase-like uncharacterized protein